MSQAMILYPSRFSLTGSKRVTETLPFSILIQNLLTEPPLIPLRP